MWLFAQEGGDAAAGAAGALGGLLGCLIYFAIIGLAIAGLWTTFAKAGKPGWAAIVPIYNIIVMLEIVGRPIWWVVLFLIPCVNIIVSLIVFMDLAKSFGQGIGFAIGLWLLGPIFFPILGFGSSQYIGPAAAEGAKPTF